MSEPFLSQLRDQAKPSAAVKNRVRSRVMRRIAPAESLFADVRKNVAPTTSVRNRVRARTMRQIHAGHALGVLEQIRDIVTPSPALRSKLHGQIFMRLEPIRVASRSYRPLKWTASFALFALAIRVSPFLFLAPPTIADSAVTLLPTRGEVSVSVGGLWQPVSNEMTLEPGTMLRTHDGELSILFHDDGVIRLGPNTTISLNDTAKRFGPDSATLNPTLTLFTGELWVQGLMPAYVSGIRVETSYGTVVVNEGSVSVAEDDTVTVRVFDRRAKVLHGSQEISLVAGQRTELWEGNIPLVKKIAETQYDADWPSQNLARDAVHRREIAQLQQERRASVAGILPTSKLYPVKRVAEAMDVLLTFDEDARMQKRIAHANTRLNEAAALLSEDQVTDAAAPLAEYTQVLLAMAGDFETGTLQYFLLQQSLAEATSDMAAALPDDEFYLLKKAVLEASVAIDGVVSAEDVQGMLIMDTLAALIYAVSEGDVANVQKTWIELQPHLAMLEQEEITLQEDMHKEILALLGRFAEAVQSRESQVASIDPELTDQLKAYLPVDHAETVSVMSDEELTILVQGIRDRIFTYHMTRSRLNQFAAEVRAMEGHPEQGRILRRLYVVLPDGPELFPDRIRKEITRVRWQREGDMI
ncbi:hypothetical protein COU78_00295 [Candidatus Peregrinibacteria bacterium CG10_big_fil_rev_8_21_14_0_10_49_24]|nr:MAG: hypothetical protein COV83_06340 [Candidatus Peregrinibacteria bacterium CG11_big_fil_rev_8_21_14_0_20_49_14]PIR51628.1 MAG: hypothetical protein COU78_00295 [Candidatus Peregrinibacteria bacterium CG10_big_fil_rev_8_21_14_0_10_49_24]PJA68012.1 MAG: hypothetical protein CO157_01665 [Candidatus Peregrinibacteria bacterium CG_4_9_14_3_um_filter_49_12]